MRSNSMTVLVAFALVAILPHPGAAQTAAPPLTASSTNSARVALLGAPCRTLDQVSLSVPGAGRVVARGQVTIDVGHGDPEIDTQIVLSLSDSPKPECRGSLERTRRSRDTERFTLSGERTFTVSAPETRTFYLSGRAARPQHHPHVMSAAITVTFVPQQ
jgi:hypothetical protein